MIQENRYRPLGASGIRVSSLGTGTNRWAQGKNDEAVFQAYQSLVDAGVNFFDTAEVYNAGKSERLLGACLQGDHRPVVIASKFAPLPTRLTRRQSMNVLDACRELNVAMVAYRPLEGGRLKSNTVPGAPSVSPLTSGNGKVTSKEQVLQDTLDAIAQQRGKSVSQVALNWLLRRDEHVIPIPGATKERHALENADTLGWELSVDEFAAIDEASSPWKRYTGRESRKFLKDAVNLGIKRLFRGRS